MDEKETIELFNGDYDFDLFEFDIIEFYQDNFNDFKNGNFDKNNIDKILFSIECGITEEFHSVYNSIDELIQHIIAFITSKSNRSLYKSYMRIHDLLLSLDKKYDGNKYLIKVYNSIDKDYIDHEINYYIDLFSDILNNEMKEFIYNLFETDIFDCDLYTFDNKLYNWILSNYDNSTNDFDEILDLIRNNLEYIKNNKEENNE